MTLTDPTGNISPEQITQMMQNPAFQQMAQSALSSPGMMDRMAESIPGMRNAMDSNPAMRQMMSNPETMRNMMNPENIQALMQLQQALRTLEQGGLGQMFSLPEGQNLGSLFGGAAGRIPPVADPETTYANQLQQLQEMGFIDSEANVTALQATGGNVNAAVERLLSQM